MSVQRELTANTAIEMSYLGSKITNIGIPDSNINQLTEEQLALGATLLERVPNPYFGIIPRSSSIGDPTITRAQLLKPYPDYTAVSFYRNNVGTTNYQGLAFSIRQRMSRGLTYSAAYTRSKLTDVASSVFDASILTGPLTNAAVADSHNLERDRDYSTGDIPHYFAASVVWDLPMGEGRARHPTGVFGALVNDWIVATFMTMQSGVPVAVTQANSLGYAGFTTQRPNLVGDPTLPADERTPARWFDTAAFATANQFTHRIRLSQSGARAVVPRCRSRGDAARERSEASARSSFASRCSTCSTRRISAHRRRSSDRPASGRSRRRSIHGSCSSRRSSGSNAGDLSERVARVGR